MSDKTIGDLLRKGLDERTPPLEALTCLRIAAKRFEETNPNAGAPNVEAWKWHIEKLDELALAVDREYGKVCDAEIRLSGAVRNLIKEVEHVKGMIANGSLSQ